MLSVYKGALLRSSLPLTTVLLSGYYKALKGVHFSLQVEESSRLYRLFYRKILGSSFNLPLGSRSIGIEKIQLASALDPLLGYCLEKIAAPLNLFVKILFYCYFYNLFHEMRDKRSAETSLLVDFRYTYSRVYLRSSLKKRLLIKVLSLEAYRTKSLDSRPQSRTISSLKGALITTLIRDYCSNLFNISGKRLLYKLLEEEIISQALKRALLLSLYRNYKYEFIVGPKLREAIGLLFFESLAQRLIQGKSYQADLYSRGIKKGMVDRGFIRILLANLEVNEHLPYNRIKFREFYSLNRRLNFPPYPFMFYRGCLPDEAEFYTPYYKSDYNL